METLWCLLLLAAPAALARDVTDEEYARFPRLYHLDDYSACLARPGGLYCLGSFHIAPLKEPHPVYNMLKEYSQDPHHFNRTQLHRGYCVSSRCPGLLERNASLHFERCAALWARRLALRTSLAQLGYCRTYAQELTQARSPAPMDVAQKVFLYVVALLVALNVVGTSYDVVTGDNAKKSPLLSAWSVRGNWRRLVARHEGDDVRLAALAPVQGLRVLLMVLIMATHSGCIHDMLYLHNPRWIEQISRHPVLMIFLNGTSVVQVFVLLSNFLLGYNLLIYSKTNKISYKLLPYITIKRIARISPVYLLVVGYAATWRARGGAGPQWAPTVGAESEACRRKFWSHVFYVNNLLDPEDICLVQTWFLAVDMQLYVLAGALGVRLARGRRRHALAALAALAFLSCVLNGVLAYIFDWKSIMYFAYPSKLKTMYSGIPSFSRLYQAPWGSLPACLIGLFAAFLHFELQESGVKVSSFKVMAPRPVHVCAAADGGVAAGGARAARAARRVAGGRARGARAARARPAGRRAAARDAQRAGGLAAARAGVARLARAGPHVAVGADGALVRQPRPRRRAPAAHRRLAAERGGRLGGDNLLLVLGGSTTHRDGGDADAEVRDITDRAQGDQAVVAVFRRPFIKISCLLATVQ